MELRTVLIAIWILVAAGSLPGSEMVVFWTVDEVTDPQGKLPPGIQPGMQLGARITIGGPSADQEPQDPRVGRYPFGAPGSGISIAIPDLETAFASDAQQPSVTVHVVNDDPERGDQVSVVSDRNNPLPNGEAVRFLGIGLGDSTGKVLPGDDLPKFPLDDRDWDSNLVSLLGDNWSIFGFFLFIHCSSGTIEFLFHEGPPRQVPVPYDGHIIEESALGAVGRHWEFEVYPAISSTLPGTRGVQAYQFGLSFHGDILPGALSTEGTVSEGAEFQAFRHTDPTLPRPGTGEPQGPGVLAFCAFRLSTLFELLPVGTATVLRIGVRSEVPMGSEPVHGSIRWDEDLAWAVASVSGESVRPCRMSDLGITVRPFFRSYFLRGDTNGDGTRDLSDSIRIFERLFVDSQKSICLSASDANSDEKIDLSDGIFLLQFFFLGGKPPAEPFLQCGPDPGQSDFSCDVSACQ